MPGLVTGHQGEDLSRDGGGLLEPAAELLVEEEAGELSGAGALEELDEDAAGITSDAVGGSLEGIVPHEVLLVEVLPELLEDGHELILVEVGVDLLAEELLHLVEVSGVEAGGEEVLAGGLLDTVAHLLNAGLLVDVRGGADLEGGAAQALRGSEGGGPGAGSLRELRGADGHHGGDAHDGGHLSRERVDGLGRFGCKRPGRRFACVRMARGNRSTSPIDISAR